ncbi:MAG: hypothetical protein ACOYM3_12680 [Terrimicrobiaceae bacterium]
MTPNQKRSASKRDHPETPQATTADDGKPHLAKLFSLSETGILDQQPYCKFYNEFLRMQDAVRRNKFLRENTKKEKVEDCLPRVSLEAAAVTVNAYCVAISKGHTEAARRLIHFLNAAITQFENTARAHVEVVRPMARKATGWPCVVSDHLNDRLDNAKLLKLLEVGLESPIRTWRGTRTPKTNVQIPPYNVVIALFTHIQNMREVAKYFQLGSPPKVANPLVKGCLEHLLEDLPPPAKPLLPKCAGLPHLPNEGLDEYFGVMWDLLMASTGDHPERVRELREKVVHAADLSSVAFNAFRLAKGFSGKGGHLDALQFLKRGLGPDVIENRLRNYLKSFLKTSFGKCLSLPGTAHR